MNIVTKSECSIDLKELIKQSMSQEQLANKLKLSRRQVYTLLDDQQMITIGRLEQILSLCGYKLCIEASK